MSPPLMYTSSRWLILWTLLDVSPHHGGDAPSHHGGNGSFQTKKKTEKKKEWKCGRWGGETKMGKGEESYVGKGEKHSYLWVAYLLLFPARSVLRTFDDGGRAFNSSATAECVKAFNSGKPSMTASLQRQVFNGSEPSTGTFNGDERDKRDIMRGPGKIMMEKENRKT
ncbi:hypothetical protein LR48_Vigan03g232400 [Vigna angularis]|uniref:Uncharacterized protein n=1 Tax=Phaseolus angularis TaxID=3914 RepID=A0A0L9U8F6_PHAAN|nr:hypothetical protein LR48_Vigan03g232400 [Vigna angularis]